MNSLLVMYLIMSRSTRDIILTGQDIWNTRKTQGLSQQILVGPVKQVLVVCVIIFTSKGASLTRNLPYSYVCPMTLFMFIEWVQINRHIANTLTCFDDLDMFPWTPKWKMLGNFEWLLPICLSVDLKALLLSTSLMFNPQMPSFLSALLFSEVNKLNWTPTRTILQWEVLCIYRLRLRRLRPRPLYFRLRLPRRLQASAIQATIVQPSAV